MISQASKQVLCLNSTETRLEETANRKRQEIDKNSQPAGRDDQSEEIDKNRLEEMTNRKRCMHKKRPEETIEILEVQYWKKRPEETTTGRHYRLEDWKRPPT